eukprot:1159980-Pelagomonas_calceolata.AAC.5
MRLHSSSLRFGGRVYEALLVFICRSAEQCSGIFVLVCIHASMSVQCSHLRTHAMVTHRWELVVEIGGEVASAVGRKWRLSRACLHAQA